jgi:hypothetical protein
VDDLGAADVALELDPEALGLEGLRVELAEDELLGEVLRADAQRRRIVRRARRSGSLVAAATAREGQQEGDGACRQAQAATPQRPEG